MKKKFNVWHLLSTLLFLISSFSLVAQIEKNKLRQIDSLFAQWNSTSNPGMQVIIRHKGKVVFDKSYGMANLAMKIPNDSHRPIWVASMSKQFTAAAVAILIQQGKITLEDTVDKYLPGVGGVGRPVQVKHLLYHTSGLRDAFTLTAMSFKMEDQYSNANVIKYLKMQKGRNFQPGDRFEYNNSGYVLLAAIVEKVSGTSFPEFVRKHIFSPLKMNQSVFYDKFPSDDTSTTVGYSFVDGKYNPAFFRGNSYGSTGLVTTAADLTRWDDVFYRPLLGQRVKQLQDLTGKLNNGTLIQYGLGLEIEDYKGKLAITHSGADAGFKSEMLRIPEEEFTGIILSNTEDAYNNTDRLFAIAEMFIKFNPTKRASSSSKCVQEDATFIDTSTLASMRFFNVNGNTIRSSRVGHQQQLEYAGDCSYTVKDRLLDNYIFNGHQLQYKTRAYNATFVKVKDDVSNGEVSQRLAGTYYSEELGAEYNIFDKEGVLYLKLFNVYNVPLILYTGGYYVGDFMGVNILEFSKGPSGEITGMSFSREGIHRLHFKRISKR